MVKLFWYIKCGVRRGGVLSPHLFGISAKAIDDVIKAVHLHRNGCYKRQVFVGKIL